MNHTDHEEHPPGWTKRLSRGLRYTVSRVTRDVRKLRIRLVLLMILPSVVSLSICVLAGEDPHEMVVLLATLATISGLFACIYDTISQFSEAVYRAKSSPASRSIWAEFCEHHDIWRTARYGGVHFVYNGPYHTPKLLFLNWMYPGTPTPSIAWHKWIWATFLFSPGESLGVLSGVQIMRDGGCVNNVLAKMYNDGFNYQMTKWVGHAIPHYLSFLTTDDVVGLYLYNFGFKALFEIVLSILAARPVKNKSETITAYTHIPSKGEPLPRAEEDDDEEAPLTAPSAESRAAQQKSYGAVE